MMNRVTCSLLAAFLIVGLIFAARQALGAGGSSEAVADNHGAAAAAAAHSEPGGEDHGAEEKADHDGEEHDGEDGHDEAGNGSQTADEHEDELELTESQKKEIGLATSKAGPGSLHSEVSLSGEIRLNEDAVTHIVPRVPGIAAEIKHSVGDHVQAGDILAVLDSAELAEVKTEYFERYKEALYTEKDLARARSINANTGELLAFLEQEPDLDALRQKKFGDMGEFRSRLILSYTEFLVSRKTFVRKKSLFDEKIASENDFLASQNDYEKALAEYLTELDNSRFENRRHLFAKERAHQIARLKLESGERRLRIYGLSSEEITAIRSAEAGSSLDDSLAKAQIIAPQSGTIIEKHINRGERVGEDSDIFTIADLATVWVDLKVPARDIHLVQRGMEIIMESQDGDRGTAEITVAMPLMDEETRTATVRAVMENQGGHWKPGAFVTGHVRIAAEDVPVVVPLEAVQNLEGNEVVFLADDHGFKAAPVVTGRRDHTGVEIISGLRQGESYVTRGAFELKAIMVTSSLGSHAGHGH